jgi:predicted acyltransferase
MAITESAPQALLPKKKRLLSLDALRGFDMFWIVSGEGIFHGLADGVMKKHALIRNPNDWTIASNDQLSFFERLFVGLSNQLQHSPWNGFTFYDLIFPLFIFISGVSMPFSYEKHLNPGNDKKKSAKAIYYALIRRTLILIFLGMVVNGLFKWDGYENTRFASVLGRIALSTFFAAIIYLNFSLRKQLIWLLGILLGYYIIMIAIPVPGFGNNVLTPEGNLAAYIDRLCLPGKLHRTVYDPEGLLSTIPAIATALLGVLTGTFLNAKKYRFSLARKALYIFIAGIILVSLGLLWNPFFPVNKNMWTSSFVLVAGGFSLVLFSFFYYIIDVKAYQKWSLPFIWIGTNSILIYVCAHGLFNFESSSHFLFGGIIAKIPSDWQSAALWLGVLLIQLGILKFLYDKKWFLKV